MRISVIVLAAIAAAVAAPAIAHPEHDIVQAPATPEQEARGSVMRMITQAKLPTTWGAAKLVETKTRTRNGTNQTVVTLRNDAEPKARRMLYVVMANGAVVSTAHRLN